MSAFKLFTVANLGWISPALEEHPIITEVLFGFYIRDLSTSAKPHLCAIQKGYDFQDFSNHHKSAYQGFKLYFRIVLN